MAPKLLLRLLTLLDREVRQSLGYVGAHPAVANAPARETLDLSIREPPEALGMGSRAGTRRGRTGVRSGA